jgi:uncharacterized protein
MKWIALLTLSALAVLAGCASSPPSRFYDLTAVAPQAAPAAVTPGAPVRVAAVHIPSTLDREEIVRTGPGNALEINGLDRWGAPLDEMVQRILTQDLLERLPAGKVVLPSGPAPAGTGRIVVDLLAFQSDSSGAVELRGSWSLLPAGAGDPALVRDFRYSETTNAASFGDQAAVMSRLLGQLADDIARSLPQG